MAEVAAATKGGDNTRGRVAEGNVMEWKGGGVELGAYQN
jgi:hypothetical protein